MEHDEFLQAIRSPFHFATCDAVLRGCKIIDISKPLQWSRLSKKVRSPLGPLCEGAPPAGGGGENCAVARNISGSDWQKNVFLPCCVCRDDHWSPASLPQQRIFRDSFLQGKRHGRAMLAPTRVFRQFVAAPHFRCPLCRTGVYFSLLTKAVSLCYLVIG